MDKRNKRSERNYRSQGYAPQQQDDNQQTPPPYTQKPHNNQQSIPPQFQYQPVVNSQQRNSQTQDTRQAYQSKQPEQMHRQYGNYQQNSSSKPQQPSKKPKKKMSKKTKIILITFGVLFVIGIIASGSTSKTDTNISTPAETARQMINDTCAYYDSKILTELPALAEKKDQDGMITLLEEAIARFKEEVTLYMNMSYSDDLTAEQQQACLDMKTGLYGATSTALEPLYEVLTTETGSVPDNYATLVVTAGEYLDKAQAAIR